MIQEHEQYTDNRCSTKQAGYMSIRENIIKQIVLKVVKVRSYIMWLVGSRRKGKQHQQVRLLCAWDQGPKL